MSVQTKTFGLPTVLSISIMSNNASDMIIVNAGGRLYTTSINTLLMSGSGFFQGLLGPTGRQLAENSPDTKKRKRQGDDENHENVDVKPRTIFVDCDPDLFNEVLYFMRRRKIKAEIAKNSDLLENLEAEAEFFALKSLENICREQREKLEEFINARQMSVYFGNDYQYFLFLQREVDRYP